jgi:hypothetical protein
VADPPAEFAEALRDRYVLERELGHGGMATAYLAEGRQQRKALELDPLRSTPAFRALLGRLRVSELAVDWSKGCALRKFKAIEVAA